MRDALYTVDVHVGRFPRVVYFSEKKEKGAKGPLFEEVSRRVARLAIAPVEGDAEGAHWLRRLDPVGKTVWRTRHPSLEETFWHAEWEYEVKKEDWKEQPQKKNSRKK